MSEELLSSSSSSSFRFSSFFFSRLVSPSLLFSSTSKSTGLRPKIDRRFARPTLITFRYEDALLPSSSPPLSVPSLLPIALFPTVTDKPREKQPKKSCWQNAFQFYWWHQGERRRGGQYQSGAQLTSQHQHQQTQQDRDWDRARTQWAEKHEKHEQHKRDRKQVEKQFQQEPQSTFQA